MDIYLYFSFAAKLSHCGCPADLHNHIFDPADYSMLTPRCECCFEGACLCPMNSTIIEKRNEFKQMVEKYKNAKIFRVIESNISEFISIVAKLEVSIKTTTE